MASEPISFEEYRDRVDDFRGYFLDLAMCEPDIQDRDPDDIAPDAGSFVWDPPPYKQMEKRPPSKLAQLSINTAIPPGATRGEMEAELERIRLKWAHYNHPGGIFDYIRDPSGKIVYPFDFWEDCIEVYKLSRHHRQSNGRIAESYSFKSSNAGGDRTRRHVVKILLEEAMKLIHAVYHHKFPPEILSGDKQPTMIF